MQNRNRHCGRMRGNYGKISEEVYVELKNNSQKEQYIISEFKNKFRF